MKKLSILLTVTLIFLLLASCGQTEKKDDGFTVISTVFAPFDFARNICPDDCNVSMLLSPGVDIHAFEPTPKDIIAIESCDLFIYIGGESEEWVETMLGSMEDVRTLRLMDYVNVYSEEIVEGMETDEDEEDHEEGPESDEHIWTSPENAKKIVSAIGDALREIAPDDSETIASKTGEYLKKLDDLDNYIQDIVDKASDRLVIFADRFPMRYFTEQYGISYYAAFPGCSSNTEPSASVVAFLIDKIKENDIKFVFYTEFSNQKMADAICEATGAEKLCMHSCHNVSKEDHDKATGYIELMYLNADALSKALK